MERLVVVIMGQNCEKFLPMCLESLKRVNESKMWDLIERNAIKIWARDFFNLKVEDIKWHRI